MERAANGKGCQAGGGGVLCGVSLSSALNITGDAAKNTLSPLLQWVKMWGQNRGQNQVYNHSYVKLLFSTLLFALSSCSVPASLLAPYLPTLSKHISCLSPIPSTQKKRSPVLVFYLCEDLSLMYVVGEKDRKGEKKGFCCFPLAFLRAFVLSSCRK